jgi:hypothetical protein
MMEEILEGRRDAPAAAPAVTKPSIPEAAPNQTQFFPGSSALELPPPPEEDFFQGAAGFASLSLDYETPVPEATPPIIEATVVEEVEPALVRTQPSGLEIFAMTDPFGSAKAPPPPSPVPTAIADVPSRPDETSVAGALPPRRKADDLDLDIGHFFTDEND